MSNHTVLSLLAGLLATTALVAPAYADEAAEVDELVVTGQREAQRAAIAVKRAEFVVADVVAADDIGKMPDHNIAAALRRIPGISVMEDQGEPRFPVVRGLRSTYNRTTVDGAIVGSVDESGRTVPLDIVPSVMVGRLEVVKTVTPASDGNAIGGTIDVTTRSAFDHDGPFFSGLASYGSYERSGGGRNDKPSFRGAFAPRSSPRTPRCANTPPPARRSPRAIRAATASRSRPSSACSGTTTPSSAAA